MVTPPDAGGARLEMGVQHDGRTWTAFACVHDEHGCHDGVLLTVDDLRRVSGLLTRQDPVALPDDVIGRIDGAAGGGLMFRRGLGGQVVASVTTPQGMARQAAYDRAGVVHMADALLERVAEGA
jgi:hypothetical protein